MIELNHIWGPDRCDWVAGSAIRFHDVDEVYRACEAIRQRSGKILREAGPTNAGNTILAPVADPDGVQIELLSPSQ